MSSTNQSAVSKNSKVYKKSKKKFRKNALGMDYTEHEDKVDKEVEEIYKDIKKKKR